VIGCLYLENKGKHNNEMTNSLTSMLSKNSDDIKLMAAYKDTKADGTPNSKFSITVEDDIQHPQGETMVRILHCSLFCKDNGRL
jgi:hypothetical protein